jgi:hypothetical protein
LPSRRYGSGNHKAEEENLPAVENNVKSVVGHSGNSNVDVEVLIETTAIAYAMLSAMYATGSLSEKQFRDSVRELDYLMEKRHSRK